MPTKKRYKTPAKYRAQRRKYYAEHKEQSIKYSREWRAKNRKTHRAYQRGYYGKHRGHYQRYQRQWYKQNEKQVKRRSKRWAKHNPERRREIGKAWDSTPHGRAYKRLRVTVRRALLRAGGDLTTAQWRAKLRRYGHRCALCDRAFKDMHHIKPVGKPWYGRNTIRNVIPLCHPCHVKVTRKLRKAGIALKNKARWFHPSPDGTVTPFRKSANGNSGPRPHPRFVGKK